jgi:hypothetical protein
MLVYHPAFDAYHCVFRLLAIAEKQASIETDRLRILDLLLCFPAVVASFRLPQRAMNLRKPAKVADNPYRTPLSPKASFDSLAASYDGALACLAAASFVVPASLREGVIVRTSLLLPDELVRQCASLRTREHLFFEQILPALLEIPLLGQDGLKARSGLLEHRYDTAQA